MTLFLEDKFDESDIEIVSDILVFLLFQNEFVYIMHGINKNCNANREIFFLFNKSLVYPWSLEFVFDVRKRMSISILFCF